MIKANTFVQIHKVILFGENRAENLPKDTAVVPFEMRIKGALVASADIGDLVKIKTITGRIESGILIVEKPYFSHNFGGYVERLREVREIILLETEGAYE